MILIRPQIDKRLTSKNLVDFDIFLNNVFPKNKLHREIASAIVEYLIEHDGGYLMYEIVPYIQKVKKITHTRNPNPTGTGSRYVKDQRIIAPNVETIVSKDTIGKVWKSMWRSGLIGKGRRSDKAKLSKVFAERLRDLADYWENYMKTKTAG